MKQLYTEIEIKVSVETIWSILTELKNIPSGILLLNQLRELTKAG